MRGRPDLRELVGPGKGLEFHSLLEGFKRGPPVGLAVAEEWV